MEGEQIFESPCRRRVSLSCLTALRCGGWGCDVIVQVLRAKSHLLRMKGEIMQNFDLRRCKTAITWLRSFRPFCHCFDVMVSPSFIAFAAKTLEMYYDVMKYATFSRGLWLALCKTCRFHSILQRNITFSFLTWLGSPMFLLYLLLHTYKLSMRGFW